jgi:hypothetical protein
MNITLNIVEDIPTPFAGLHANPDRIIACLPRVDHTEDLGSGRIRVVMQTIQATPLVRCTPVGVVQIQQNGNALQWIPYLCEQSNGQLSGTATANPDGSTHIEAVITISDPSLPQIWTPALTWYARGWAIKMLGEFHQNWTAIP